MVHSENPEVGAKRQSATELGRGLRTDREGLDEFLLDLERRNPALTASRLKSEIDELLGRPSEHQPAKRARTPKVQPADAASESPDFSWFGNLVATIPAYDEDPAKYAAHVEVGLLARGRAATLNRSEATRREISDLSVLIDRGESAFEALVLSNIRLVFHWSKGVAQSVDSDWAQDAFQVGCIGLIRGLQSWDYRLGYKVSTFVSWHIRQAIQRWRANDVMIIRVPVHVWDALGADPAGAGDAARLGAERAQDLRSIDAMQSRGEDQSWDGGLEDIEERIDAARLTNRVLALLDEREAGVLTLRFGLEGDEPANLEDIGRAYGVTRERIRQIEKKALEKIRDRMAPTRLPGEPSR
ncbi:sigma-70 family RNA polymerase sigma factor [Micromonospora sp. DT81.3]|uniref:sigma-70 family RNA polymerase sigma factor n=1 Tax=Micromonospora sp. DT81.3 TaxID=3416523 RepID=UPI003CE6C00D